MKLKKIIISLLLLLLTLGLIHVAHVKVRKTFFHGNTIRCLLVINSIVNVKNNRSNHDRPFEFITQNYTIFYWERQTLINL